MLDKFFFEKDCVELTFSDKYDKKHAIKYYHKHQHGFWRKLSHWREVQMIRSALKTAGNPLSVLDLPCGAGRFWPLLSENKDRRIYAADNSAHMIDAAMSLQPIQITQNIYSFQSSAFDIQVENNAVDCILCIRLLHHIGEHEHRLALLREFYRVTRNTVIITLWVDGNYKAWRRRKSESTGSHTQNNRFLINRLLIEAEFKASGFDVLDYHDFFPKYAMWRTYVLKKIP